MATPLSTLLATRLDAVLGTTLAQNPVLLNGGRPGLTTQPAAALHGQDNVIPPSAERLGENQARAGRSAAQDAVGRQAAATAPGRGLPPAVASSVQAELSEPARTLLALLLLPPESAGARRAATPLWADRPAVPQHGGEPRHGEPAMPHRAERAAAQAATAAGRGGASGGTGTMTVNTAGTNPHAGNPIPAATAPRGGNAAQVTGGTVHGAQLAPAPLGMATALAGMLADSVTYSGLFYESHLAAMSFGKRSPEQLAREPQARLGQPASATPRGGAAAETAGTASNAAGARTDPTVQAATSQPGGLPSATTGAQTTAPALPTGAPHPTGTTMADGAAHTGQQQLAGASISGVHADAIGLVRQQLEILANGQFTWQGEAWPGAELEWEIQDDGAGQEEATANTWSSRLQLKLPGLGDIEARISLTGKQLILRLVAPDSAELLKTHASLLRHRLQDNALTLSDLSIVAQAAPSATAADEVASLPVYPATTGSASASGAAASFSPEHEAELRRGGLQRDESDSSSHEGWPA